MSKAQWNGLAYNKRCRDVFLQEHGHMLENSHFYQLNYRQAFIRYPLFSECIGIESLPSSVLIISSYD